MKFETKLIHIGEEPNYNASGDVVIPIHLSSTFARKEIEKPTSGYEYSRSGNPTRNALEKRLAMLENAKYGLAFSSGLAAETVIALSLLKSGNNVIAFDDLYGGTKRLFNKIFSPNFGVDFTYIDATNVENVKNAISQSTRLIWLETPTNPLMKLCDIKQISEIAKEHGIYVVVDNTFMSPYFQKPLELGADLAIHSTTKFINGHSDSIGGAIMLSDEELYEKLKFNQNATGAVLSPFDSYLVLRGAKTLAVRMQKHHENTLKVVNFLERHKKVKNVNYPGLQSHPQYMLAKRQMSGFGSIFSFEINGGLKEAKKFLENLGIFLLAESVGGVESLIEHPALMTHASVSREERDKIGISDALIRASIGIEDAADLIEDINNSLSKV